MSSSSTGQLEAYLHQHIPLSQAMAVRVRSAAASGVRLSAPLEPNINHRSTVFGGSASAVAILAGWTLLHLRVGSLSRHSRIVIQRSAIEFLHPIDGEFEAVALPPSAPDWQRFERALQRGGRARVDVRVELRCAGVQVGELNGTYVVLPTRESV